MRHSETAPAAPALPARTATRIHALVRAARAGDRARFDALFERCVEEVYAAAWTRTRDAADAEALTRRFLVDAVSRRR